jgi:predicted dehydrogenase
MLHSVPGAKHRGMAVAVGLVGAGPRAAGVHAPALAESPDIEFVGVWARDPSRARRLADRHGVRAFGDFGEVLESCEAVSFAVPPAVQSDLGVLAAGAGKAVLLEVPIAWDIAGAESLAEAVAAAHVVSQVAFSWRYSEGVRQFLKAEAPRQHHQGGAGRIVRRRRDESSPWQLERGLLTQVGPNVVDLLDAALGTVADVDAQWLADGGIGLKMEHQGGRFSESSLDEPPGADRDVAQFEFFGPHGSVDLDCSVATGPAAYATMFAEFAAAVRAGEPHELDVSRGLHVQRAVEAADTELLL